MAQVLVIGGGFAGLAAAQRLREHGLAVRVLEAKPEPRLRPVFVDRRHEAVAALLEPGNLNLTPLDKGVFVVRDGVRHHVSLSAPVKTAADALLAPQDWWKALDLLRETWGLTPHQVDRLPESDTSLFLRQHGCSPKLESDLAAPLSRFWFRCDLEEVSARLFLRACRTMFTEGVGVAEPGSLLRELTAGLELETGAEVAGLALSGHRLTGVKLASGETIAARWVVLAVGPGEANRLLGQETLVQNCSEHPMIVAAPANTFEAPAVTVSLDGPIQSVAPLGEDRWEAITAPSDHAPQLAQLQLASWFSHTKPSEWVICESSGEDAPATQVSLLHSDFGPNPTPGVDGLYVAGDYSRSRFLGTALQSGLIAADLLLEDWGG